LANCRNKQQATTPNKQRDDDSLRYTYKKQSDLFYNTQSERERERECARANYEW